MTLVMTGGMPRAYNPYEALADKLALAYDWRRDDLVTVATGLVSALAPVVGTGTATESTDANKPGYVPPGGFSFDGDDRLTLASPPLPSAGAVWYYAGLLDQTQDASDSNFRRLVEWGGVTNNTRIGIIRSVSGGVNRVLVQAGQGGSSVSAIDASVDFSGVHYVEAWYDGTKVHIAVDGGTATSTACAQNIGTTRLRLGVDTGNTPNANAHWIGYQYLHLWLDELPTTDERAALVAYFNAEKAKLI